MKGFDDRQYFEFVKICYSSQLLQVKILRIRTTSSNESFLAPHNSLTSLRCFCCKDRQSIEYMRLVSIFVQSQVLWSPICQFTLLMNWIRSFLGDYTCFHILPHTEPKDSISLYISLLDRIPIGVREAKGFQQFISCGFVLTWITYSNRINFLSQWPWFGIIGKSAIHFFEYSGNRKHPYE